MSSIRQLTTLSPAQVASFEADGFLLLERVVDDAQRHRLSVTLDELIARPPERRTPDFQIDKGSTTALRNISRTTRYWVTGAELIRHPVALGAMRDLLGDDVRFHHMKVFLKPPFEGSAKEWHQDLWSYIGEAERARLVALGGAFPARDASAIAIQTYLDDSTEENGCLRFVPGSHTGGLLDVNASPERVREDYYPPASVVRVPAPAGSMVLFHALVLHYSGPNRSPNPRRAPIVQYFAPTDRLHFDDRPETPLGERML